MDDLEKIRCWIEEMRQYLDGYDINRRRPIVYDRPADIEAEEPQED